MKWVTRRAAEDDLDNYALYIARDSKAAAIRFLERAYEAFETLARNPGFGTRLEGIHEVELRTWRIKGFNAYVILYQPLRERVRILRILHASRDWTNILNALVDEL
jgi:plasmid stabilization system protein ParE